MPNSGSKRLVSRKNVYKGIRRTYLILGDTLMIDFVKELESAKTVSEVFKLVKSAVWFDLGQSRSGLELGISNIDNRGNEFIGAYYPQDSNIIVLNKMPLERIAYLDINLYNPYLFNVLIHEYLKSMGYSNESRRKELTVEICERFFGKDHIISKMAHDMKKFFPNINYPIDAPRTPLRARIVREFDNGATSYIG